MEKVFTEMANVFNGLTARLEVLEVEVARIPTLEARIQELEGKLVAHATPVVTPEVPVVKELKKGKFSKAELETLHSGKPAEVIAVELNRSIEQVSKKMKQLGIEEVVAEAVEELVAIEEPAVEVSLPIQGHVSEEELKEILSSDLDEEEEEEELEELDEDEIEDFLGQQQEQQEQQAEVELLDFQTAMKMIAGCNTLEELNEVSATMVSFNEAQRLDMTEEEVSQVIESGNTKQQEIIVATTAPKAPPVQEVKQPVHEQQYEPPVVEDKTQKEVSKRVQIQLNAKNAQVKYATVFSKERIEQVSNTISQYGFIKVSRIPLAKNMREFFDHVDSGNEVVCPLGIESLMEQRYTFASIFTHDEGKSLSIKNLQLNPVLGRRADNIRKVIIGKMDSVPAERGKHGVQIIPETTLEDINLIIKTLEEDFGLDLSRSHAAAKGIAVSLHQMMFGGYARNSHTSVQLGASIAAFKRTTDEKILKETEVFKFLKDMRHFISHFCGFKNTKMLNTEQIAVFIELMNRSDYNRAKFPKRETV